MSSKNPHTKKGSPPIYAVKLLHALVKEDLAEEVLGDLEEKFYTVSEEKSLFRAKLNYWYQVINYIRPFALKSKRSTSLNQIAMFQHNLKLTFRNFRKHKSQFLINLIGLSSGMACALFIYLWVADEFSIDRFHANADRMYQVMTNHEDGGEIVTQIITPGLLLDALKSEVPEVEKATAWTIQYTANLSVDEAYHPAVGLFASREFLDVFSYPLLKGHPETALTDKTGIIISKSLSSRLFKEEDPIGQSIEWDARGVSKTFVVTGVLADIPGNSSFDFDYILPWDYFHDELFRDKSWSNYYALTTVLLNAESIRNKASQQQISAKINSVFKQYNDDHVQLSLVRYTDLYLYDKYENGQEAGGLIDYVHLLIVIGVFILFIASVNFINLSTAKATSRTREIGVKKSLGASRKLLIWQYLTESVVLSMLSLILALLIAWALLPYFNQIVGKSISAIPDVRLLLMALAIILLVGVVAGLYPALYLSRLKVLAIFRGATGSSGHASPGRKALVIVQFTLSIILIASVLVVYKQMAYVRSKNLGYNRDNLIYFEKRGKLAENYEAFVAELKNIPGISGVAATSFAAGGYNWTAAIDWEGKSPEARIQFHQVWLGVGAMEMIGFELVEGRTFSPELEDQFSIILNETAVAAMGLKDPVGKTIRHWTGDKKIIGVVKDFNYKSLHEAIGPTILGYNPAFTRNVMARITKGNESETIGQIEKVYREFNPGYGFEPTFVDQDYQALYQSEDRISFLAGFFAGFAILISCLGLFGLALFTTERRTKEIGIRKVLGSSAFGIVYLLSKDFTKMVVVAAVIALPVSYLLVSNWLENFAYHIPLHWSTFLIAGCGALLVAWITVGIHTYRSALANPVNALRSE